MTHLYYFKNGKKSCLISGNKKKKYRRAINEDAEPKFESRKTTHLRMADYTN